MTVWVVYERIWFDRDTLRKIFDCEKKAIDYVESHNDENLFYEEEEVE